jgi:formylmethanofuran dehydrogenase subunit C
VKPLTFTLRETPPERLDLSPLTPERLAGMSPREIGEIRLGRSRRALTVGDVFRVSGKEADSVVLEGGSSRFDGVGTGMTAGTLVVTGDVGARAGRAMRGGRLLIEGSAGPHAGSGMRGGWLEILGDAGDHLGGPLAGELAGMNGGVLVVRGSAGACAGDRMRRGVAAVLKGCGDYAGSRMIAGTLVVTGTVGRLPGYMMRRGSILLDRLPEDVSPSFVECGSPDSTFAAVFDRYLVAEGILKRPLLGLRPGKFGGDNAVAGTGEILFRQD